MSNPRRTPQQERGARRLRELLEAAAAVFAETGYDAATMTSIAERAGASIGALYQYFPNKEAVVHALRLQYLEETEARWLPLTAEASTLSIGLLVDRIVDMLVDYNQKRPAYLPLISASPATPTPAARHRLREHIAGLFRQRLPTLNPREALRVANITVQVLKGMIPLFAEAGEAEKHKLIAESKLLLRCYLKVRLKPSA